MTENVEKTDNQTVAQNKNPLLNVKKKKNKKTAWNNITQNTTVPHKAYEIIYNFDEADELLGKTLVTPGNFLGTEVKLTRDNKNDECPICFEPLNQKGPAKGTGSTSPA